MKVGELKAKLATIPDDWDVVCSDVDGKCINLVGFDSANPLLYLTSVEEFPEDWYDEYGLEINYYGNL